MPENRADRMSKKVANLITLNAKAIGVAASEAMSLDDNIYEICCHPSARRITITVSLDFASEEVAVVATAE